jgi:hypothetical protein
MEPDNLTRTQKLRRVFGLTLITLIALLHVFRVGNLLDYNWRTLYSSYASDLMLPFGMYFLLCISEFKISLFRKWYVKASFILAVTTLAEILQYFGVYALGITFDYLDIVMYFTGVGVAVCIDRLILRKYLMGWDY